MTNTWDASMSVDFRFQWVHDKLETNDGVRMGTVELLMRPHRWDLSPPTRPCREKTYDSLPPPLCGPTQAVSLRCSDLLFSSLGLVAIC